jgi:hypothetical protein
MKNYFYVFAILVCFASCKSSGKKEAATDSLKVKTAAITPADTFLTDSANIPADVAAQMVKDFRKKPGYYDTTTSCWFKKDLIVALNDALNQKSNNLDGFRIYLGLKNKKQHTFFIVPTMPNGTYRPDTCGSTPAQLDTAHQDIYTLLLPGYKNPVHKGREDITNSGANLGSGTNGCPVQAAVFFGLGRQHEIPCKLATSWVNNKTTGIIKFSKDKVNTYSEWFETAFVREMVRQLNASGSNGNKRDGIRVYLARRRDVSPDCYKLNRHVFLFALTDSVSNNPRSHIDDYTTYNKRHNFEFYDNGEQCLNNCYGATMQ